MAVWSETVEIIGNWCSSRFGREHRRAPSPLLPEGLTLADVKEGISDHHFRASQAAEGYGADLAPMFELRGESLGLVQSLDVVCPVLHSDDPGQLQALHGLPELQEA